MFIFDIKHLLTMQVTPELTQFLSPYAPNIQKLTIQLRSFIIEQLPTTNELIWDNYNAVAIAYSKSTELKDAFCHLSVYGNHVNFGFNRGAELSNSSIQLLGKGKLIRHITVPNFDSFPKTEVKKLLAEAIEISEKFNPLLVEASTTSQSMVMSISKKKRRPS